jgi:flagellar biosynthesis/type III secretory pathway protein FliH
VGPLALFTASDAIVLVALIGAAATVLGPVVVLAVSSLKRIRAAAEQAVHNTQTNGADGSPPSPWDQIMSSHEYMIGQIHAANAAATAAAQAAWTAQAGIEETKRKLDAGFAEAKAEREKINDRIDRNIEAVVDVADVVIGRLDALDGDTTVDDLRKRLEGDHE